MPRLEDLKADIDAGHTAALTLDKKVRYHVYFGNGNYVYVIIQDNKPVEQPFRRWETLLCREPQLTIQCAAWRVL